MTATVRVPGPKAPLSRSAVAAAAVVVSAMAAVAALAADALDTWLVLLAPAAVLAGVLLVWLALVRFEWFVLTLLAVRASLDGIGAADGSSPTDPNSLLSILFLGSAVVWLAGSWHQDGRLWRNRLDAAALFFAVAAIASTLFSQELEVSVIALARLLSSITMVLVLVRLLTTPERVQRMLAAVFVSAIIPIVVTYGAQLAGRPLLDRRGAIDGTLDRMSGTFALANGFSRYLLFLMLMGAALLPHLPRRWKWLLGIELLAMGGLMVLTYTRSSWVMLVVGLCIIGWFQNRRMLWGLLIGMAVLAVAVPSVLGRFSDLFEEDAAVTVGSGNSLVWRLQYWTELLPHVSENPFTGIGLRATEAVAGRDKAPHNDFVQSFVEMGVVGIVAYLALLAAFVWVARQALRYARPGWERGVAVGYLALVVSFLFVSFVSNTISQVVLLWYFLAFSSAGVAVARFGYRARREAAPAVAAPTP